MGVTVAASSTSSVPDYRVWQTLDVMADFDDAMSNPQGFAGPSAGRPLKCRFGTATPFITTPQPARWGGSIRIAASDPAPA